MPISQNDEKKLPAVNEAREQPATPSTAASVSAFPSATPPMPAGMCDTKTVPPSSNLQTPVNSRAAGTVPPSSNLQTPVTNAEVVPGAIAAAGKSVHPLSNLETPVAEAKSSPVAQTPIAKNKRFKFKDQGVRASKSFFLQPSMHATHSEMSATLFIDGTIVAVPNKKKIQQAYIISWNTSSLPTNFDASHLRSQVLGGDKTDFKQLKAARLAYDQFHPSKTKTSSKRKSKTKAPPHPINADPRKHEKRYLENMKMAATEDSPPIQRLPPTIPGSYYAANRSDSESASDDGSDMEEGNTYLPPDLVEQGYCSSDSEDEEF